MWGSSAGEAGASVPLLTTAAFCPRGIHSPASAGRLAGGGRPGDCCNAFPVLMLATLVDATDVVDGDIMPCGTSFDEAEGPKDISGTPESEGHASPVPRLWLRLNVTRKGFREGLVPHDL